MKKKTEIKRQTIVDMAAEVFREKGFERASMSEIRQRVGGSNATLYNYFPSKEALFFEVMVQANQTQFRAAHDALDQDTEDIAEALQNFGKALLSLLYSPAVMAVRRLIAGSFSHCGLGQSCYDLGPKRSLEEIADFLQAAMRKGKLRTCDPDIAALHLRGLLESELLDGFIFQMGKDASPEEIAVITQRAVDVFMAAYGPGRPAEAAP